MTCPDPIPDGCSVLCVDGKYWTLPEVAVYPPEAGAVFEGRVIFQCPDGWYAGCAVKVDVPARTHDVGRVYYFTGLDEAREWVKGPEEPK